MVALDAAINADVVDPGWWADPKWWFIGAVFIIILVLIGIYMKMMVEHQKIGPVR